MLTKCPKEKPLGFQDKNDCTVRALATVMDIEYLEAWTVLKNLAGRKKGNGIIFNNFLRSMPDHFEEISLPRPMPNFPVSYLLVKDVAEKWNKGKFIVNVTGHTFAMIDGVIMDYAPQTYHEVFNLWKVKDDVDNEKTKA